MVQNNWFLFEYKKSIYLKEKYIFQHYKSLLSLYSHASLLSKRINLFQNKILLMMNMLNGKNGIIKHFVFSVSLWLDGDLTA